MKGLIIKDLYNMKSLGPQLIIMLVAFGISFSGNEDGITIFMCVLGAMVCVISTLSLDEYCNWNMFACSMPVTRLQIAAAKYVTGLLFALLGPLVGVVMTVIAGLIRSGGEFPPLLMMLQMSGSGIAVGLLMMGVMIPVSFKYGVNKGRYVLMGIAAIVAAASVLVMKLGDEKLDALDRILGGVNPSLMIAGIAVLLMAVYAVSCLISIHIMEKKEF